MESSWTGTLSSAIHFSSLEVSVVSYVRRNAVAAALAVGCVCGAFGPVASAAASKAGIKRVVETYVSKILEAEGKVLSALGEYDRTGELGKVDAAIGENVKLLHEMRSKIAAQSAGSRSVKQAKRKFETALKRIIRAESGLERALALRSTNPEAAQTEANDALAAIKKADTELDEAVALLK
jgi:hypothetical protein